MNGCPPMTFDGLSPDRYQQLLAKAQTQGLQITGDSGSTSYQGIDFTWNYDPAAQILTLECTNKPFFVPCSMIEQKVRSVLS